MVAKSRCCTERRPPPGQRWPRPRRGRCAGAGNARLGAEVRQQAAAVRESRRRLLTVADGERRTLEARLRAGPVGRLRWVDQALAGISDQAAARHPRSARVALDDLARLARRAIPRRARRAAVWESRARSCQGMPIPVRVVTHGPLAALPEAHQALAYFFCSECLTNVARHPAPPTATVQAAR